MRCLALLLLFIVGVVAGMAAEPLLPDGAREFVADFQHQVRLALPRPRTVRRRSCADCNADAPAAGVPHADSHGYAYPPPNADADAGVAPLRR